MLPSSGYTEGPPTVRDTAVRRIPTTAGGSTSVGRDAGSYDHLEQRKSALCRLTADHRHRNPDAIWAVHRERQADGGDAFARLRPIPLATHRCSSGQPVQLLPVQRLAKGSEVGDAGSDRAARPSV